MISMFFNEEELKQISGFSFFSLKPIVVAVNLDENQLQKNEFPIRINIIGLLRPTKWWHTYLR